MDKYTEALISELEHRYNGAEKYSSMYLGGGSPILLGKNNLLKLFKAIQPKLINSAEKTIELNASHIDTFDVDFFNRVSIGVQSTNTELLKIINREFDMDKLLGMLNTLKATKIDVSMDFMFGIPEQNIQHLKNDLDFIIQTRV